VPRSVLRRALVLGLALAAFGASCRSFGPLPSTLAEVLPQTVTKAETAERRIALIDLDSTHVSGRFTAVVVVRHGERPALRAQVIPEVGGKLLDLVVTPERVRGYFPHAGPALDFERSSGRTPPRGLLSFLAASLVEEATPISSERALGARPCDEGWELQLRSALEGVRVIARLDARGRLLERRYSLGGVGWRERFEPHHTFESHDFRWVIVEEHSEAIAAPPDTLFELALPSRSED